MRKNVTGDVDDDDDDDDDEHQFKILKPKP